MIDVQQIITKPKAALFIHVENLMRTLEHGGIAYPDISELPGYMFNFLNQIGEVVYTGAYTDWFASDLDPRILRRQQIEPQAVLSKENGVDRTDLAMSLDIMELIYEHPEIEIFMLVTGDSAFYPLIQKLKKNGKIVFVCGGEKSTGQELMRGATDFVPLEQFAKEQNKEKDLDFENYNWENFVVLMNSLENKLPYIGIRYLMKRAMNYENVGLNSYQAREELINYAEDNNIITIYDVNKDGYSDETIRACKLNPENNIVKRILSNIE